MPGRSSPLYSESSKPVQESVHERAAAAHIISLSGPGVYHHAGCLVDHGEVVVFKNDVERNVFSGGLERSGPGFTADDDRFPTAQLQ